MSDSSSPKPDAASPSSLLGNLRRFRFQKKSSKLLNMSDEDSNLASSEVQFRRKAVNVIEDSDSDAASPRKSVASNASGSGTEKSDKSDNKDKESAKEYLSPKRPEVDPDVLSLNGNSDDEEEGYTRKRRRDESNSSGKKRKKKRRKVRRDVDEDGDSDNPNFKDKVFDSDEESDVEISNVMNAEKKAVLEFMRNASSVELLLMSQCSQKKANAIVEARPFKDWRSLVAKFQDSKYLDTELLNSAQELLATRQAVDGLMKKCLRISANIERDVALGGSKIKEQPKELSSSLTLAPYQMVGLNWLAVMHGQNVNGILADEMGLGKTVQVIAFLTYLKEAGLNEREGPHLIVVPSSTMENWWNELKRWSPGLSVVQYYGSQKERKDMRMQWRNREYEKIDVWLTTYNLISSTPEERRLFRVMPINYVVFDEAHMLKNMSTIRYENLIRINAQHRILLTGTPLQNNLLELMSLLMFVMPSLFAGKQADLKSLFSKNNKIPALSKKDDQPLFEQEQVKNAKLIMRPFVLRRLKSEVLRDLPIKTDQVIKCPMTEKQKTMYKNLVAEFSEEAGRSSEVNGVGMMMQLRKLANHPLLTRDYYNDDKLQVIAKRLAKELGHKQKNPDYVFEDLQWMSDYQINQLSRTYKSIGGQALPLELIPEAAKLRKLDKLLPDLKAEGHRVLIFSQFTMVLDILEEYLTIRGHAFLRMDGNTPVTDRQKLINVYTTDPSIFIFLLSTRAGGLGINLTAADTVIIHDIDFNPYNDKQAEDRCHRVGQKKPVTIIRLLSEGTIDEGMYEIAKEKLMLERQITGNEESEGTDKKSVLKLLKMTLGLDLHNRSLSLSPVKNSKSTNGHEDAQAACTGEF